MMSAAATRAGLRALLLATVLPCAIALPGAARAQSTQAAGPLVQANALLDRFAEHLRTARCITPEIDAERLQLISFWTRLHDHLAAAHKSGAPIDSETQAAYFAFFDRYQSVFSGFAALPPCSNQPPSPPPPDTPTTVEQPPVARDVDTPTTVEQPTLPPSEVLTPSSSAPPAKTAPPPPASKQGSTRPADAPNAPYEALQRRLDALEATPSDSCVTPEERQELDAIKREVQQLDDNIRAAQATGVADRRAALQAAVLHDHIRDVEKHMQSQALFCPAPQTPPPPPPETQVPPPDLPPSEVIPSNGAPPPSGLEQAGVVPHGGFYAGLGGSFFQENDVDIGLVQGVAGYRFLNYSGFILAIEAEVGVGVIDEEDRSGSFRDSVGISYSTIPFIVGSVRVAPGVELFARAGYGVTRFNSSFSSSSSSPGGGSSSSSSSDARSEGTAAFGGGAQFRLGGRSSIRVDYTRDEFDNGTGADRLGVTFLYNFGH